MISETGAVTNLNLQYFIDKSLKVSYRNVNVRKYVEEKMRSYSGSPLLEHVARQDYAAEAGQLLIDARNEYVRGVQAVELEFKQWLEELFGVADNPKKENLYSIIRNSNRLELGLFGNFIDIYKAYEELVQLIK